MLPKLEPRGEQLGFGGGCVCGIFWKPREPNPCFLSTVVGFGLYLGNDVANDFNLCVLMIRGPQNGAFQDYVEHV